MNEQQLHIQGKLQGAEHVQNMISRAPLVYERAVRSWLYSERNSFVGSSRQSQMKDGYFRKKLMKKKNSMGKPWSLKIIRQFKGVIDNVKDINMKLKMGLLYNNRKKIHEVLESFEEDHSINSSKYMPIPVSKNILTTASKTHALFKSMMDKKEFDIVRKGNTLLFFNKTSTHELLFIGKKRVNVKKQFDFEAEWNQRHSKVIERYKKAIDRATIRAEKAVN